MKFLLFSVTWNVLALKKNFVSNDFVLNYFFVNLKERSLNYCNDFEFRDNQMQCE